MAGDQPSEDVAIDADLIDALSEGIGPRPPTSDREHVAAEVIAGELEELGLSTKIEEFASQRSFGPTYLVIFVLALLARPLSRSSREGRKIAGGMFGIGAAALGVAEARFALWSPLNLLRTRKSQNVWAGIEAPARPGTESAGGDAGDPRRTICLVSHMDSSRSGLMFHPAVTPHLGKLVGAAGLAVMINALAPLLNVLLPGRLLTGAARLLIGASAAMVVERELRGEDVPGANDNASGVAACLDLAAHFTEHPLENSRLVILVTGSEESGVIGMRDFLRNYDTEGWLFVNFDGVGADAPLRVLARENGSVGSKVDAEMLAAAEEVGAECPELEARPLLDGSGLPYDATAVLARGGRAISIVNQEGAIPDYHWPTDTADRVSVEAFSRAVRFGATLIRKLDANA
ncbi:MAG: M28 family peptidase [Solirubrobacterales bacterium]|nr:M28 family peptidase [Solirubrobacterales bacterium]OJU95046.1 MAG: hypothetical protein BGO23_07795 [Solirubrobacterales bacterium 67-14]